MKNTANEPPNKPIFYITRDLERALPLLSRRNSYIITNDSPFAKQISKKNKRVFLIPNKKPLDTHELLEHGSVLKFLKPFASPQIIVFKNTTIIERICEKHGFTLLNPPAVLSAKIEEKISQIEWLGDLSELLPPHFITRGADVRFSGESFIVQYNRSHTGSGTVLVRSEADAKEINERFPDRPVKVTKFIEGPVFTSNNVVGDKGILPGPIMYQITGLSPFTFNPFATIGNDWSLPKKILTKNQQHEYFGIAEQVGKKMIESGWRGLFGIDVILDEKSGHFHLLEINARQPASTSYESRLQGKAGLTTLNAHVDALLQTPLKTKLEPVRGGSQIIVRVPPEGPHLPADKIIKELKKAGFETLAYPNLTPGSDFLRIMSKKGIMSDHKELNKDGKKIETIVRKYYGRA